MQGKQAFLELLRQEGVETIFGNPGTTELPLMDALAGTHGMRYVLGLHEAVVMAMADGYAQAGRRFAAVNLHAAPGLGNALGMVYNARKAGAPVLITAGQQARSIALSEPLLWDDLATLARPFVKWSVEVTRLPDLPRAVHRAAKVALTPPTGPVFLSVPADLLMDSAEIDLQAPTRVALAERCDPKQIEHAARLLVEAERPIVFAGDCVAQDFAFAELTNLAELLGVPVYAEAVASTASFPSSHPAFAGVLPRLAGPLRAALERHDLILSVGADLVTLSMAGDVEPVPCGMKIVHLDTDPWELGKNFPTAAALLGKPRGLLTQLADEIDRLLTPERRAAFERRRRKTEDAVAAQRAVLEREAAAQSSAVPVSPLALLHAIGQVLPRDAVVIEELLSSAAGVRQLIRSDDPQSYYGMRGGGIGVGLPWAVGAKLGLPSRPVVALVGDGSAMYSIQALWTAAHEGIAVTWVIFNNRSYRILKQRTRDLKGETARSGRFIAMDLDRPPIDFVALARSLGVEAVQATTLPEAKDAVHAAVRAEVPRLVEVLTDRGL